MNTDEFWNAIDSVHKDSNGDMDRKCELLQAHLSTLEEQDLKDFIHHFDTADVQAYTWELWGAAYVMLGGCSDDAFSDFRATLISQGREIYEQALVDPDSLAALDFEDEDAICYEGFQYVHSLVAEETLHETPKRTVQLPSDPTGEEWDEVAVNQLYPKLAKKYSVDTTPSEVPTPITKPISKPWWKFW